MKAAAINTLSLSLGNAALAKEPASLHSDIIDNRVLGMLLGSAIGDAAGGPVEFQPTEKTGSLLANCRSWPAERKLDSSAIQSLAASLPLLSYSTFRPDPEPYGQWQTNAPPGTVTDDTRLKMVMFDALRRSDTAGGPLTKRQVAEAFDEVHSLAAFAENRHEAYPPLCSESFAEFVRAAKWVLGQRTEDVSPPNRIWGGLPTCCGQMILAPLAGVYPGHPNQVYRNAYAVSFFDQGTAKDTNAAIVAGLATALHEQGSLSENYASVRRAMISTDPYQYHQIPFITRPIQKWIEQAESSVDKANGRPAKLYQLLIESFHPHYFWEARFTFGCAWAFLVAANGIVWPPCIWPWIWDTTPIRRPN